MKITENLCYFTPRGFPVIVYITVMNIEEIREYCLAKPGVTEGFPFGEDVLVFKVMNKMFALTGLEADPLYVNLKCDSAAGGPSG